MANKSFNRTVEEINPLFDKIDNDYSKSEIDGLISSLNIRIDELAQALNALSERVATLENKGNGG